MYIIVCQTFNIHTILIFTKYFYLFYIELRLKDAADKGFLQEYIFYEILLPKTPFIAFQLPEETILRIKDYILKIRNKD